MASTNAISDNLLNTMNPTGSSTSASSISETQDRFMKLLITQMKNQDPLNPMDNAEVTSQMAQLSTVTGIEKMNATLSSFISSMQATQALQASSLIGRAVLVEGNSTVLAATETEGESSAYFGVELPVGADNVKVNIKDAGGNVVKTYELKNQAAGISQLSWNGFGDDGTKLADGRYSIEATATTANSTVASSTLSYEQVMSVSSGNDGVKLNLSNLAAITTDKVKQIF
ncbi:flagellar hook assembly protein FlgD [Methylobacillus glycogenes]|uniref:flagellar hook assembly protein FlgD n=1 Tax=Methylobacillus glycogenes TaxID=406 RepID=UPI0004716E36|nr:flagellar hook assembly protein FlgD [Methylobacillus glycogenes]MBL8505624.1 flagellar hook assembly protein FlgD [Methylobacillus glycogenes]